MERELLFGQLRIRSRGLEEEELVRPQDAAAAWKISGDAGSSAHFETVTSEGQPAGRLHYDFGHGSLIRLTRTFQTKTVTGSLPQIQLYLRADESWHSLRIYVGKRVACSTRASVPPCWGTTRIGARSVARSRARMTKATGYAPGSPCARAARGPQYVSDPQQLKITLKIRRAGPLGAWWAKLRPTYSLALDYIPFWRYLATSVSWWSPAWRARS